MIPREYRWRCSHAFTRMGWRMKSQQARVETIYRKLKGVRGVDDHELWQHAIFFAKDPEERCRISLKSAHLALSSRRSNRDKDVAVLPVLERTLRMSRRLNRKQT